jgi:photosystem II oxygen-evolving enhancer protein 2
VTLDGQDKAFRDVIEPLESVSLSVAPTTRASLAEAGTPQEVAQNLVAKSSSPQAKTELVSSSQVRVTPVCNPHIE